MQPADDKIPYNMLLSLKDELEEENTDLHMGLDHLRNEADRYGKMIDALLDLVILMKEQKNDLPF